MDPVFTPLWYVLHTKSRCEKVVNELLNKKSIDAFLPTARVRSKRKDRKLMLDLPLFPGYVFVKSSMKPEEHLSILKTPGAVKIIGNNDGPVSVETPVIESLQIMVSAGEPITAGDRYKSGEKVMVVYGPFTGVEGIFTRYGGKGRVIVNIDLLGQSATVEVNEDEIEKIPQPSS